MRRFTEKDKGEICVAYKRGMTIRQLMRDHRCSQIAVYAILDEAGLKRRGRGWHRVGEKNPRWKGGLWIKDGYRYILSPNHPRADKMGYVPESHLVMEKILGRYLQPEEIVHHINCDTLDNGPENLMLFPNQSAHTKHHRRERKSAFVN